MKKNYFSKFLLATLLIVGSNLHSQTTWTGNVDRNWNTNGNWTSGVPDDFNNVTSAIIPDVSNGNDPVITNTAARVVGALTINSGATLTLTGTATLQQNGGTFTQNGSMIFNSGTQFRTNQDVVGSGLFTYNRTLGTVNWYLVSSPFEGQSIDAFVAAEGLATANNDIGLAPYLTATNVWDYVQNGASGLGDFITSTGYSVKLQSPGDISFTGTLLTQDKTVSLTTTGQGYNLIGNPYPIHINSANGLTRNSASLSENTIWLWNQGNSTYEAKNVASNFEVAPVQSFFVKSDGAAGNFEIQESDQTFQGTDTFQRTEVRPEINLTLSNESTSRNTTIYYIDGTTTAFDNGYDSSRFMAGDNSFAFYTHLVSDSEGVDYDIQSLPVDNYENMIIPVGINAIFGTDITIDASITDFPQGINVYLEDQEDNSFTLLNDDSNFTTTLESDLNGIGRFYLHTTSESLSTSDDVLNNNNISIYISSKENLRIVGVQNVTANVKIYNILSKEVFNNSFKGTGVNDVPLPNLAEGIYVVRLSTDKEIINKKVIIQ
jgi:hypothetical protein